MTCLGSHRIRKNSRVEERRGLCPLRRESPASLSAEVAGGREPERGARCAWVLAGWGPPHGPPCGPKAFHRGHLAGDALALAAGVRPQRAEAEGPWRRRGGPTVAPGPAVWEPDTPRRLRAASGRPGRGV